MMGSQELSPAGLAADLAVGIHRLAPHYRAHDLACEFPAEVCADAAARLEVVRAEGPTLLRIYDREVGVGTDGDRPFAGKQAEELGGRGGGEMGDALEREAARVQAVGQQHGKRGLDARDAAPRLPDVVLTFLLVGGRAGRVVRP